MSISQIAPVSSKSPAEATATDGFQSRQVSDAESADFANQVLGAKSTQSVSMDDVEKVMTEGIVNNIVNEAARQRQELKEAMEDQS